MDEKQTQYTFKTPLSSMSPKGLVLITHIHLEM